jgi:hypothetical protein
VKFNQATWYSKLAALILFVALPFLGFWAGVTYERSVNPKDTSSDQKVSTDSNKPISSTKNRSTNKYVLINDSVNLVATFQTNVWRYSGLVQVLNVCTYLEHNVLVRESFPEQVSIELTTKMDREADVCAQVITQRNFSGEFQASAKADITVSLDGKKQ